MANSFSGLTAYVNEDRFGRAFWTEALMRNDVMPFIVKDGLPIPGVKNDSIDLAKLSASATIADGSTCVGDLDKDNDTVISKGTTINLKKGFISGVICPHDGFETYYTAQGMPAGQHYKGLGVWQAPLMAEINRHIAKRLALNFWQGNQSGDTWTYDGWIDQLLAANMGSAVIGTATPTDGGAAGTDAAGVFNICEALVAAAMTSVDFGQDIMDGNVYIVMNAQNREFMRINYQRRYGLQMPEIAVGLTGLQNNSFGTFLMPGTRIPVELQQGVPQSTIIMSRKKNQVLAFDLESDFTNVEVGMDQYNENMWWKLRMKVGGGWQALDTNNVKYWGPAS
jgi:hypothetical protein